jgi:DNA polymerase III subunit epsilon
MSRLGFTVTVTLPTERPDEAVTAPEFDRVADTNTFAAVDVETANEDMSSICQIGVAVFQNGELNEQWTTLVNPETWFNPVNVEIHGIDEEKVTGAPTFPDVLPRLRQLLDHRVVACHSPFDRGAIHRACDAAALAAPACRWLDTARVARRAWREPKPESFGLADVCDWIGYHFRHHDALEDAKAAAHVLLAAMRDASLDIPAWLERVEKPVNPEGSRIEKDGNPDGALFGEVLVFTGALCMPRQQAADIAAALGCEVDGNVTKKTTMLIVGDQDIDKLAGHEKSRKHRKAEELISDGQRIRILTETDFNEVARMLRRNP